ncbi:MAG: hypothetical protein AB8D78_03485 [Akkermansiaceae bacterium]
MKTLYSSLVCLAMLTAIQADPLSDADREALLEQLENIQKEANSKVDARFRVAITAFKQAMASNQAALDLYLDCEEKVNYTDMKKKSSDFRDWKRKNAERLSDSGFKMALRQQLRWLVLTLEAASEDPDRERLAVEASKVLDSIFSNAEDYTDHKSVLQAGVTGSVFARAYDIKGVKAEDWPLSPVQIEAVYDQIILPPLRRSDRLQSLRQAWNRRMIQEGLKVEHWDGKTQKRGQDTDETAAYERFVTERVPQLRWEAELDLFKSGDERAAAMRMLKHIDENISHKSAPKWTSDFVSLLQGNPEAEDEEDDES